jgi:ABC-type sugar transport system substrate-binding protein
MLGLTLTAACGSDAGGSGSANPGIGAQEGAAGDEAAALGLEAAKAVAAAELPSDLKIGLLNLTFESESTQRIVAALESVGDHLGIEIHSCDGGAVPARVVSCGQSLISGGADAIISNSTDPAVIQIVLESADEQGIPVLNIGGMVPESPLLAASYAPNEVAMTEVIDEFLLAEMKARSADTLAIQTNNLILALRTRYDVLMEDLKGSDIEVVATNETDFSNPSDSVGNATRTVLTANPDVGAMWASIDVDLGPMSQAARSTLQGQELPIIVGFYGNQATLGFIKDGLVTGVAEAPIEACVYAAVDQILNMLVREQEPVDDPYLETAYPEPLLEPIVVTQDNLPAEGQYVTPKFDFVSFFETKWTEEYSLAG